MPLAFVTEEIIMDLFASFALVMLLAPQVGLGADEENFSFRLMVAQLLQPNVADVGERHGVVHGEADRIR